MYEIEIPDMDLEQIAVSGQCFRMKQREEDGVFEVAAAGEYVEAVKRGGSFLFSCTEREFAQVWAAYFDCHTDYAGFKRRIAPEDEYLTQAARQGWGVRILGQDLWEMLVTFLISQNNNIPRIRGSVAALCERFGERKTGKGLFVSEDGSVEEGEKSYYSFPGPENIVKAGIQGLCGLGLGYRDKFVFEMAGKCCGQSGKDWLLQLKGAEYEEAHRLLTQQYGIGKKVADCVCLFGLHHIGAFPVDTHVKQILEDHYPRGFPLKRYEGCAGIFQQYMFYVKVNRLRGAGGV